MKQSQKSKLVLIITLPVRATPGTAVFASPHAFLSVSTASW
jgi:hypothetical protein